MRMCGVFCVSLVDTGNIVSELKYLNMTWKLYKINPFDIEWKKKEKENWWINFGNKATNDDQIDLSGKDSKEELPKAKG